jgi:hypothetical protein
MVIVPLPDFAGDGNSYVLPLFDCTACGAMLQKGRALPPTLATLKNDF